MATFSWPITVNGKVFTEAMFTPWSYVTSLPDLIGNFVEYAQSADAATKAEDAKASADAAAAALAQAQGLIPQITTGSTNSLAYPEQIRNLITTTDIVDVFVYDTRFDSDGGAWTERCQHTSWHQEALGTATRGVKRAFPKVAILIVRTSALAIYDALDLDGAGAPRMWMTFSRNGGNVLVGDGGTTFSTVFALNGRVYVGASASGRFIEINFPADISIHCRQSSSSFFRQSSRNLAARNDDTATYLALPSRPALPSNESSDIAARVLPGAPIDTISGLPIPTILVAHPTGASFIHPDGRVSTITVTSGYMRGAFLSDTYIALAWGGGPQTAVGPIFYGSTVANTSWQSRAFGNTAAPAIQGGLSSHRYYPATNGAVGSNLGMTFMEHDHGNLANGMSAFSATNFATGWMPGDTRLAALCDGVTGAVAGGELITNGSFDSDISGWTNTSFGTGGSIAWNAGTLQITGVDALNRGQASQAINCVVGETYLITGTIGGVTANLFVGTTLAGTHNNSIVGFNGTGFATVQFVATQTQHFVGCNSTGVSTLDSVSVRVVSADRSFRARGMRVVGSLSRNIVATGADVAAFSGFSAANYLEQPYSSLLDFGDADFAVIGWLQRSDASGGAEILVERDSPTTGPRFSVALDSSTMRLRFKTNDGADEANAVTGTTTAPDDGMWHQFACVMRGTTQELWLDGSLMASVDATAVGTLTNTDAILRVGVGVGGTSPFGGSLAMIRLTAYAPTRQQIERMFFDERQLFEPSAKAFIGGTSPSVVAVKYSRMSNRLAAATGDGVSIFSGLRRVEYLDSASASGAIANDAMRSVSMESGVIAFGTTANVGVRRDAVIAMERLPATLPAGFGARRLDARGVTTDATPLVLAPRAHVGERETLLVEAVIVGRVYGTADGQRLSYVRRAIAYRDTAGNVTLQGSVQTIGTDTEVTSTADATLVVDTTAQTIGAQVTGVAATRIAWRARFSITRITDAVQYEEVA